MSRHLDPITGISATAHDTAGARFLDGLATALAADRAATERWKRDLVAAGIHIAHPDDGWVDREQNTIHFAYPTLWATPAAAGARVALGTYERWRVVTLTRFIPSVLSLPDINADRWGFAP